jgi:transcription elongation GreA/GreB family factor
MTPLMVDVVVSFSAMNEIKTENIGELPEGVEVEEWFFSQLEEDSLPIDKMFGVLEGLSRGQGTDKFAVCADLLKDDLTRRKDADNMLRLMKMCATGQGAWSANACKDALALVFDSRLGMGFLESCGFDEGLAASECVRRLDLLRHLEAGVLCCDKTWGFGIVKRQDDFYKKITVDFNRKSGHQMSFAYAGEVLELVGDDHLLARKYRDADSLAELIKNDPDEVVRITLRSYGDMDVQTLKDHLTENVFGEGDWKHFWDGARKKLKKDPLVDIPAKRSERIRLLASARATDDGWFAELATETDVDRILELTDELATQGSETNEDTSGILVDRLLFVMSAGSAKKPGLAAQALLAGDRVGVAEKLGAIDDVLFNEKAFLSCVRAIPARDVKAVIALMDKNDRERTCGHLLSVLPRVPLSVLNESIDYLTGAGRADDVRSIYRSLLASRDAGPQMLVWICRHLEELEPLSLTSAQLLDRIIAAVSEKGSGELLRAQNRLKAMFDNVDWLKQVLGMMSDAERTDIIRRVSGLRAWDVATHRSVLGRMVKLHPELEAALATKDQKDEVESIGRITSVRSYRERQEQLRQIVEEEIPQNSKDIGVARSYGDLSENAEYDAAKAHQRVLMARQGSMESDLATVHGTDFARASTDKAGVGTGIIIRRPDGKTERYYVLGEWDSDLSMDIISCKSRLGELLIGRSVGEEVLLPSAKAEEPCEIVEVLKLPPDIVKWVNGE